MSKKIIEWRPVSGWEGFYEASNDGQVRSIRRLVSINSVTPERKRWMGGAIKKQRRLKGGYLGVTLTGGGKRSIVQVHRAVLLAFVGEPPAGCVARHLNGNPKDNRLENLAWGTHTENMQDRKAHGNYSVGEDHHMAKLTSEQVMEIYQSTESGVTLSERYGVHQTKISAIRNGKTWRSVTGGKPAKRRVISRKTDKMNFEKAEKAREMRREGFSLKEIAQTFSIHEGTAGSICRGETWRRDE